MFIDRRARIRAACRKRFRELVLMPSPTPSCSPLPPTGRKPAQAASRRVGSGVGQPVYPTALTQSSELRIRMHRQGVGSRPRSRGFSREGANKKVAAAGPSTPRPTCTGKGRESSVRPVLGGAGSLSYNFGTSGSPMVIAD